MNGLTNKANTAAAHPEIPRLAYSMEEVAAALGIGYKTALEMRRAGQIPAFKVGKEYRVHVKDLDAAIRALAERESA